jgi:hypothetical protein
MECSISQRWLRQIDPRENRATKTFPVPKNIIYSCGGAASAFGFFSNTWMLGCSNSKPLAVPLPICPPIAATNIRKLACASVNFFQILGFTDTETIRPSQSSSKDCRTFWNVLALGILLILMVSYSFPVVSIEVFEVVGSSLFIVEEVVSLKINFALVWQLERVCFWRSILEKA